MSQQNVNQKTALVDNARLIHHKSVLFGCKIFYIIIFDNADIRIFILLFHLFTIFEFYYFNLVINFMLNVIFQSSGFT